MRCQRPQRGRNSPASVPLIALALSVAGAAAAACVYVPPGTSSGELAAVKNDAPLVLSAAGGAGGEQAWRGASRPADLTHVVVDVALDVEGGRVVGTVECQFRALRPATRDITLHAGALDVREVMDADGRVLAHRRRGSTLTVTLDEPLAAGDVTSIAVRFAAAPTRGYASSLEGEDGFAPEAYGSGEPFGLRDWLPIWDQPGDLTTVETVVRVGDRLSAVANGELVDVEDDPSDARDERTYRWRTPSPIPVRAITLAAARFETFAAAAGETKLYFHLPAGSDEVAAQRTFGETPAIVESFERRLGTSLPFQRFDQAALRGLPERMLDGGSLVLLDQDELVTPEEELDDLREGPRRIVARGLARRWFGAWITPLEEQHRWLLDGLAMQLELEYEARVRGEPDVALEWEELLTRVARRSAEFVAEPEEATRAERAERAAWVLRGLERRLGGASYENLLQAFASGERGRVVTVEDFRRTALDLVGIDVGPELAQWSGRRTLPELRVRFQRRSVEGVGESLGVVLRQVQPGPTFRLELPVVVHFDDGSTVAETMSVSARDELMVVPINKRVVDVSVDPEGRVLASLDVEKDDESWLAQAALGRTSIERMRALPELERMAQTNEEARQALVQLLLRSPEPTLREAVTRSMRFPGPACTAALERSAADDASPIVRRAALHELVQLYAQGVWSPTPEEIEGFLALLQREQSPGVLEKLESLLEIIPSNG